MEWLRQKFFAASDRQDIPLVGMNGKYERYASTEDDSISVNIDEKTRKKKKMDNVGYKLAKRKTFFARRRKVADATFALALLGIMIMIVETEFTISGTYSKESAASFFMKTLITISTLALMGFLAWYHVIDVRLYMIDNNIDDWRLAMSKERVLKIVVEFIICAIHPPPGDTNIDWISKNMRTNDQTVNTISVDIIFSLPMYLRLYLIGRILLLHSRLYCDASSQCLGVLNRIHFNFGFIFKSLMNIYPERVLAVIVCGVVFIASWSIHLCEFSSENPEEHLNLWDSLWMITITFLTVGYGDTYPRSPCGRGIAVLTGLLGVAMTALVVAVLANKLELSRAEKYVQNFVIDVELEKSLKNSAANILREGWLVYKLKKQHAEKSRIRAHQRKLLKSIAQIRDLKQEIRKSTDNNITMVEMGKQQQLIYDDVYHMKTRQKEQEAESLEMKEKLNSIDSKVEDIQRILSELLRKRTERST
ncbi:small conductance calcium-activated potassium channel protein [Lingula anatina]|uniref:Small conductance calcium-activated potassium channel protein n=1 Tax=Lingula anatina TaxID=7574 RepID=A0A1S3JHQ4_LINAN|nr:small conductance calcium-activated potassium channel protein [Lingula anatina]XP_013409922.1 small conductance calcium-activated potassium channel protein [Lingula anatina]XP_013409930.1 small conductance calcium-activated potassium channel protein [Lingula anatina]XP_013409937.1 small conductance calcium-activated potassium channel protein [Lingula anatina]|eukprot:XP_013409914.1 small conductance calcium-activated potassium channel protein [Lingula anatina]